MKGSEFDEVEFFRAITRSSARALLIGRQALIALGLPLMTNDYDFWLHIDDMALFNATVKAFDLLPSRTPEEARAVGRYVLENDEHVDVLVSRARTTVDGTVVPFDDVWARRIHLNVESDVTIALPSIPDLILTKKFAARPKDAEDIRLLEALQKTVVK